MTPADGIREFTVEGGVLGLLAAFFNVDSILAYLPPSPSKEVAFLKFLLVLLAGFLIGCSAVRLLASYVHRRHLRLWQEGLE